MARATTKRATGATTDPTPTADVTPAITPTPTEETTPVATTTTTKRTKKNKSAAGTNEASLRAARENPAPTPDAPAANGTDAGTPTTPTTPPSAAEIDVVPGDWHHAGQNGPVHKAMTPKAGIYFRAACGQVVLVGQKQDAESDNSTNACQYCATGTFAPADADMPKKSRGRAASTPAEKPAPPVALMADQTATIAEAVTGYVRHVIDHGSVVDIAAVHATMTALTADLKTKLPRSGRGVATTGADRKPATTPAVGNRVNYTDAAGATSEMSISAAVKAIAARFPGAERCVKYAEQIAEGKSLNARLFLDADVAKGRIPAGVVAYTGSADATPPPAATDAPATTPATDTPAAATDTDAGAPGAE